MYFEVTKRREAFTALPAAVRLQPAVEPLVSEAVVLPRKHLTADFATKRPLPGVHALVRPQPGLLGERFPTLEAPEAFGGLVGGYVFLQLKQARETLVAQRADIDFLIRSAHLHHPFGFKDISTLVRSVSI